MTNIKMLFILQPLIILACTLTAQSAAMTLPITNQATITPTAIACHVKTGVETGTLNLRTCAGTYCTTSTILHEGETLTQTESQTVDGWIPVRNSAGFQGWVNSKYITCPQYGTQ